MIEEAKNIQIGFEDYLQQHLPKSSSIHPTFEQSLQYLLKIKSKRFRPLLLLSVVNSYDENKIKDAYPIALALEMMHTYSLIHDDLPVMDDSNLRRNAKATHKKYDETTATLAGDALNTHAFYIISSSTLPDSIKIKLIQSLSSNAGINGMVLGQAIDCYFEDSILKKEQIEFLHIHKTGKLIASALQMGAIICDLDKELENKFYDLGIKLGLLFQIQDDILDVISDEKELGKPTNNDSNKNSFVNILGLEKSLQKKDEITKELIHDFDTIQNQKISKILKNIINTYLK